MPDRSPWNLLGDPRQLRPVDLEQSVDALRTSGPLRRYVHGDSGRRAPLAGVVPVTGGAFHTQPTRSPSSMNCLSRQGVGQLIVTSRWLPML